MRSTSRAMSTRRVGTVTSQPSASASASARSRGSRGSACTSASGIDAPSRPADLRAPQPQRRRLDAARDSDRRPCRARVPAPIVSSSAHARSIAVTGKPRIGAALEAHARFGLQPERLAGAAHRERVELRALEARWPSSPSATSESAPPITPATATGRSASAMTSMSGDERRASGRRAS